MPIRKEVFATDQIYHVFNRGVDRRPLFKTNHDRRKLLECWWFYRYKKVPFKLSSFAALKFTQKVEVTNTLVDSPKRVDILVYCLMNNHFHLLLRQREDVGIQRFMADASNSYTRWFNKRYQRKGHLFESAFQATHIETDEQFQHVGRYIHLNPYTGYLTKTREQLENYPWSSLSAYCMDQDTLFIDKQEIRKLGMVGVKYQKFVWDQADYQRQLDRIKHLILEEM